MKSDCPPHNLRYVQSSRPWDGNGWYQTTRKEWRQIWGMESSL